MIYAENHKLVQSLAGLLCGVAVLTILSWFCPLMGVFSSEFNKLAIRPLSATSFLLAGLSLFILPKNNCSLPAQWLTFALGSGIAGLALISLAAKQPLFVFPDIPLFYSTPRAASLFLLVALAILIEASRYLYKHHVSQGLALLIFTFTLMALIGYGADLSPFSKLADFTDLSLPSCLGFISFALGLFLSFPQSALTAYFFTQSTGAAMQRYLIPFTILIPLSAVFSSHFLAASLHLNHSDGHVINALMSIALLIYCGVFLRKQIDSIESQFKIMTDAAPVMMWMADASGRTYYFNQQWLKFTGRQLSDEIEVEFHRCVHPDDVAMANAVYRQAFHNRSRCCLEYRLLHHSGEYRWILENASPYWGVNHAFKGFIGSCTDITEQKAAFEKMQLTAYVFEHSIQGIMITDAEQKIVMTNPAFSELTGYSIAEIINKKPDFLNSGTHNTKFYAQIHADLKHKGYWQGETWNRRKNGELFLEDLSINVVQDDKGNVLNYIGIFTDITERKRNEERYQHLAHYDPLTDLPNRTLLTDRIEQALVQAQRHRHKIAVLFIDLNKFKQVNDSLGHHIGDLLLKEVAIRLKHAVRSEDTVARLGGDEFVILCPTLYHPNDVKQVIEKIIPALLRPYTLENHCLHSSPSIGVALSPEHGEDMKTLLNHADSAMYTVKNSSDGYYAFYQAES